MKSTHYQTFPVNPTDFNIYGRHFDIASSCKFHSVGKNGAFELRVLLTRQETDPKNFFNLAFGVWDELSCDIDDQLEVRNDDTEKILSTVANVAIGFLEARPNSRLFVEGSTVSRTRLYQREIAKILDQVPPELQIQGLIRSNDIGFVNFKKGVNFDAFLLLAR